MIYVDKYTKYYEKYINHTKGNNIFYLYQILLHIKR